jgi:hypothetical protein
LTDRGSESRKSSQRLPEPRQVPELNTNIALGRYHLACIALEELFTEIALNY